MSDSEEESVERQLKIAFLGDSSVGKTSIIKRFCQDEFTRQSTPTVGADFYTKHLVLPGRQDVTLIISDIGGQELTGSMLDKYLYNINIIVFVYDITNSPSFESLPLWMETVSATITNPVLSAAFGNKCDLEHQRAIRTDRIQPFFQQCNLQNSPVSARTGEYLYSSMMELIAKYLGVHLSKVAREQQQPVVKARLVPPTAVDSKRPKVKRVHNRNTNTAVCVLQ
ncbi:hypothetical protein PPYR_12570 [Photinus pyralis]|uniref:SOCS box domain-containing protein n=2 Tax=Photinus pyralis TaxID=7054 RepID=A0A5N4A6J4_PHOPY|nr:ras-related protein Rab-28-like [Photinus pyralis]XP_031353068.1 ras-related protein Rab-28-like [Photinus pyralis]KAB0792950.1 hypothetical protein PPYR_12570 [Photinus pyralis]